MSVFVFLSPRPKGMSLCAARVAEDQHGKQHILKTITEYEGGLSREDAKVLAYRC